MDNSKKSVHTSGALGMLLKTGQIKPVNLEENTPQPTIEEKTFKTESGLIFTKEELHFIDANSCEPWAYANRLQEEMGDMQDLITSIKENGQLQPAVVRPYPHPHGNIKYEIIFGRRRHIACQTLQIPLLAIIKSTLSVTDALAMQEEENRNRHNISKYSTAIHYRRLLDDKLFATEKQLAEKFRISRASLSELLAYTKISQRIIKMLPKVHELSVSMANKIVALLQRSPEADKILETLASEIGISITSPAKLETAFISCATQSSRKISNKPAIIKSSNGQRLFTIKEDFRGNYSIVIDKGISKSLDLALFQAYLKQYFEEKI